MRIQLNTRLDAAENDAAIACSSCEACCCRLEVMLMAEDDVPPELTQADPWNGQVMARFADGWCAALERNTMLCGIYERRPTICRGYQVGASECVAERSNFTAVIRRPTT